VRILTIRLLFPHPFGANLGCIPHPQLESPVAQQTLEPEPVPAGFHPHPHLHALLSLLAVKLFGFFAMNQHARLLSSEPLAGLRLQSLLGPGSRHCYGIITLPPNRVGYLARRAKRGRREVGAEVLPLSDTWRLAKACPQGRIQTITAKHRGHRGTEEGVTELRSGGQPRAAGPTWTLPA
jgi:hypothetical protein